MDIENMGEANIKLLEIGSVASAAALVIPNWDGRGLEILGIEPGEARRRIVAKEVAPREDAKHRAVMAVYRDESPGGAVPQDVRRRMEAMREFAAPVERLVFDQHGGLMKGYRDWEAVHLLIETDESHNHILEEMLENCQVRLVRGEEDARQQIRQLHLHQSDRSIKDRQYDAVIADQVRDFQGIIDENWPKWAGSHPQITGRFRISSNYVAKLLGICNKRVDRVIGSVPNLEELLYLDVMDANGNIQKGKARPGEGTKRGRKPTEAPEKSKHLAAHGHADQEGVDETSALQASPECRKQAANPAGLGNASDWQAASIAGRGCSESFAAARDRHNSDEEDSIGKQGAAIDPKECSSIEQEDARLVTRETQSMLKVEHRDDARADEAHQDPIYQLGWGLYAVLRQIQWYRGAACPDHGVGHGHNDAEEEMSLWCSRVQSHLRTIETVAERRLTYQRILFVGLGAELCQRLMIDGFGGFFGLASILLGRLQRDYPIWFDHVEGWVIWQAVDWWRDARSGEYHIPQPNGTVRVTGGKDDLDCDPTIRTLGCLPWLSRVDQARYRAQAPSGLNKILASPSTDDWSNASGEWTGVGGQGAGAVPRLHAEDFCKMEVLGRSAFPEPESHHQY